VELELVRLGDSDTFVPADAEAAKALESAHRVTVKVEVERKRTHTQNRCLHAWLRQLAEDLNAAGLDMKKTLRHDAEIPWNMERAKDFMWRPVQEAITDKESTADAITTDYPAIYEVIVRHLAQTHGFTAPPWPDRFNGGGQRAA
jgi:hypothetical protein